MDFLEEITKHFKDKKIDLKDESEDGDLNPSGVVSTGVASLDVILGGGFYLGKIYELYGEESAGKTTLSYQIMSEFQKLGGVVLLLESESSFDTERARELGVDISRVLRPRFKSFEEGASIIMQTIEKNKSSANRFPILIVWDTISASPTKSEIAMASDSEMSKVFQDKPILLRSWFRVVSGELSRTSSCLVLVSQVNDIIGGFGKPVINYEPAGGRGIKHHASARILVNKKAPIHDKETGKILIGFTTELMLHKSKQSPEKQKVVTQQYFNSGFDSFTSLVEYLSISGYSHEELSFGGGGWIKIKALGVEKSFQGMTKFLEGIQQLENFPLFDFFKFHAYENLKRLHPLTHLITRVNELQNKLNYSNEVKVDS